jgi:transposase
MSTNTEQENAAAVKAEMILLGIDVHGKVQVVVRQIDGGTPQPAQGFSTPRLLLWVKKQLGLAKRVVCCYEAGPFGFTLYRQLSALGAECLVVQPRKWDPYGQRTKTDSRDATALCQELDRYLRGNKNAFGVVRVPSESQELERSVSRQRQSLLRERLRLQNQGLSLGLYHGERFKSNWWLARQWSTNEHRWPAALVALLQPIRKTILVLAEEITALSSQLQAAGKVHAKDHPLPKGFGELSAEVLRRELWDWGRFANRRHIASFTGLCPTEASTGTRRRQGSINKHGNPRLRCLLVETAWRLIRWQPNWIRWIKIRPQWQQARSKTRRKQLICALARQLAIDLWRVNTGRSTLERLGLAL